MTPTHLRVETGALAQQRARDEPEGVADAELVLHHVTLNVARVRVVPLVGREPGHHEHGEGHEHVGGHYVQPDLHRQRVHEGEESRRLARGDLGHDGRRGA